MIRRPPRSTQSRSSAASDVYKRQGYSGDGIGAYHLEIPVFANDLDPNGPDPADPASGVRIPAINGIQGVDASAGTCLLYTSPSPRDRTRSRMPSSA